MITAEIRGYDDQIADLDRRLKVQCKEDDASRRLRAIPGVGPVIATAMPAFLTAGGSFASGSAFAAWLGITPRQHSSGWKERTFGITKRGNTYLRRQLINGARAVMRIARGRRGGMFVFLGRKSDRLKLLYWDGQGFCLYYKVLERGRFPWPTATDGSIRLTSAQLAMLWEGIDWRRPDWGAPPVRVG